MQHIKKLARQAGFSAAMYYAAATIIGFSSYAADLEPSPAYPDRSQEAASDPFAHPMTHLGLNEVRAGFLAANLENGGDEKAEGLINGELLFNIGLSDHVYSDPIRNFFLRPRAHVGFSVTPDEGTNQVYAGLTWETHLTSRIFAEASFGGTLHDGETAGNDPNSYGCSLMFRESASIGYELTEHVRIMATVDHMSNAGLCDQNQGLTNAGVRIGYRW
jgi:lipid A 3-O-deacylase